MKASNDFEAEMAKGETIQFCQSMADKARRKGDVSEADVWGFMQVIFGKLGSGIFVSLETRLSWPLLLMYLFSLFVEANARQQLLEHLGFHAETIEKAAMEFDIVKGVDSMSVEEKSKAPMVSRPKTNSRCKER